MKRISYLQESRSRYLGKAIKYLEVKEKQVCREFSF